MAAEVTKYQLVPNANNIANDFKPHFFLFKTRKSSHFFYGVVCIFIAFTVFLAFSPSSSSYSSPSSWFINIFTVNNTSPPFLPTNSFRSPIYSDFSSNSTQFSELNSSRSSNTTVSHIPMMNNSKNLTKSQLPPDKVEPNNANSVLPHKSSIQIDDSHKTPEISQLPLIQVESFKINDTKTDPITPKTPPILSTKVENLKNPKTLNENNHTSVVLPQIPPKISSNSTKIESGKEEKRMKNNTGVSDSAPSLSKKPDSTSSNDTVLKGGKNLVELLVGCDLYDGEWVKDDSYPLYKPGSCKLIDEQFNCFLNGRPDNDYVKLKWKPKGCTLPRLNGKQMLKLLKGKRLVFVGDSLNRNMWESLVCILKNSVKNPKNVYEAYGRHYFRTEASYSFVFKDYNFTVEFFVAPFLVQPWDVKDKNGTTKETLRLDLVVEESERFKNADFLIYNTGHWWTHEKTSKGEDYYQEGSNVYKQLDVIEAFRKAITTWGRWIDANINPQRTHVFFRGYSNTHFSGGQWNSGGQCDSETEPIRNETYLTEYPWKMKVFETVMKGMKIPISYLNITRMTDYRKDAHPSIYRKQHLSGEEKKSPLRFQDCSHWCLPGVPDFWNELLYAEMLRKQYQEKQQKTKT
ncbi:protein trichome birefringence-like 1 [Amaranthus tricolor]|uniref:protein trichome birefringence-like 1 n=1 Tax=Amaranthus tricolor TaxID=29722 RepID=UPI002582FF9C|nr:protein trichome birefringence-like 1 [Amaranthus tricolor]